jgi:FkbM family methyltransferase
MKQVLKRLMRTVGYEVYNKSRLPRFLDLYVDLKHYYADIGIATIVDVGANVGQSALYFNSHYPQAKIYSFEPIEETYKKLIETTSGSKNIQCYPYALSNMPGKIKINLQKDSQTNSLRHKSNNSNKEGGSVQEVMLSTLDLMAEELKWKSIDFLKVDAEGHDLDVIKGAEGLIAENAVKFILAEVDFIPECGEHTSFNELNNYLFEKQYTLLGFYDLGFPYPHRRGPMINANALYVMKSLI